MKLIQEAKTIQGHSVELLHSLDLKEKTFLTTMTTKDSNGNPITVSFRQNKDDVLALARTIAKR